MWASLISWISAKPDHKVALMAAALAGVVFCGLAGWLVWQGFEVRELRSGLALERAAHVTTAKERDAAITEGLRWAALHGDALAKVAALQGQVTAAQRREAQAQQDAAERQRIMDAAQPRPRTEAEKQQGVDDATRKKAAARLNRAL